MSFTLSKLEMDLPPGKRGTFANPEPGYNNQHSALINLQPYYWTLDKTFPGLASAVPSDMEGPNGVAAFILATVKAPLALRPKTETFVIHPGQHWILYRVPVESIPDNW